MRKLLIVFSLLPIVTALWPSSALALECDPAISGGPCNGSGQKYRIFERSAFSAPASPTRMLVSEPIERAAGQLLSSGIGLRMARADAGMADTYSANGAVQTRHSRSEPGADVVNDGGDKVSPASPSMNPAPQPGSGALLIAGFLGMCAVARRRISSILG